MKRHKFNTLGRSRYDYHNVFFPSQKGPVARSWSPAFFSLKKISKNLWVHRFVEDAPWGGFVHLNLRVVPIGSIQQTAWFRVFLLRKLLNPDPNCCSIWRFCWNVLKMRPETNYTQCTCMNSYNIAISKSGGWLNTQFRPKRWCLIRSDLCIASDASPGILLGCHRLLVAMRRSGAQKACTPKPSTTQFSKCKLYKRYGIVEAAVKSFHAYYCL